MSILDEVSMCVIPYKLHHTRTSHWLWFWCSANQRKGTTSHNYIISQPNTNWLTRHLAWPWLAPPRACTRSHSFLYYELSGRNPTFATWMQCSVESSQRAAAVGQALESDWGVCGGWGDPWHRAQMCGAPSRRCSAVFSPPASLHHAIAAPGVTLIPS